MLMTTVTLNTLSNTSIGFIRDVLRENLTDLFDGTRTTYGNNWIFRGQPEGRSVEFPFVIINSSTRETKAIGFTHNKRINTSLTFDIEIWDKKIENTDILTDEIETVLSNPSSTDGTDSIKSKRLYFKELTDTDEDSFKTDTELVRLKMMTVTFGYSG